MRIEIIKKRNNGFSLIEVLVVMFIAAVVFVSFYSVSAFGTRYIIEAKNRLGAVAFVNENMEIIRNLSYDKIGIDGSIEVPGNIKKEQYVTANGRSYKVNTSVRYFDDPMDGTVFTSPADLIPNDYKIVAVTVSWKDSGGQTQSVSSSSRFVPPGLETSVGGSPLSINVVDGETLLPIGGASLHITNSTTSPVINDTIQTDSDGHIMIPAATISANDHVTVTKSGYETVTTMDSSPTFTPIYGHISVITGFLNTYNYFQSRLSSLTVKSVDSQGTAIGNIGFSIGGGKVIGNDNLGVNVLSMPSTTGVTDAVIGEKKFAAISSGNYTVSMSANAQYDFIDFDPSALPAFLAPGTDMTYTMRLADKNINALAVNVKDSDVTAAPIAGAKVTLTDGATDIFTDKLSSLRGVVFYPDGAVPLEAKTYTLKVAIDGYTPISQPVTIDKLTKVEVPLTKI